ncbi:DUF2490 domain-containing protein [Ascidiimonas aurantiaca]|uniref:DUF2490 domain-containing protein n=1 Tax=Ascidiimonas aurantiaca TaxID=1685432 RepID=UPI0030EF67CF
MKFSRIFVFLLLGYVLPGYGQNTGEDRLGSWYMYFGQNRIADKWSIHSEAQFRYYHLYDNFNQLLLRTGLNYDITPEAMVTLGYAYIDTDPTFEDAVPGEASFLENTLKEHRIFQQFILRNKIKTVEVEHRYRLEQRFFEDSFSSFTEHRARYRVLLTLPLNEKWFLSAYNEIFINLQDPLFNQNRIYGAVGYRFKKNANIQFGYLKNHFSNVHFDRLQLALFYNLDFRKKDVSQ